MSIDLAAIRNVLILRTDHLGDLLLSTPLIREGLARAEATWRDMLAAVRAGAQQGARITLAASSESLLELFDALTREYEQSMQMLMG